MKKVMWLLILLSPIGVLVYLRLQPEADLVYNQPLLHFYIVTFTSFTAGVVSLLLSSVLGEVGRPRHVLVATAFTVIGVVFLSHGIATPNALINYFHPAVSWSSWLTLLLSGILFALAGLDGDKGIPAWIPVRQIITTIVALVIIYLGVAVFAHEILDYLGEQAAPWHQVAIFILTLIAWLFAFFRFTLLWRQTHHWMEGALAFVALWLSFATVSMHRFPIWQLSWWMYHVLMLISFLVTTFVLVQKYEQTRRFQLTRYYLAVSLIVTALLALFASSILANYSFLNLANRAQADAKTTLQTLTSTIRVGLSPGASEVSALIEYAERLEVQPLGETLIIYRTNGFYFYPFDEYDDPTPVPEQFLAGFTRALQGEPLTEILPPGDPPPGYAATENTHTLIVYAPLYGSGIGDPIGVVQIIQAVPELTNGILSARMMGLAVSALTMGVLFFALLLVIRRADKILTTRSRELEKAYTDLQRAEQLRDDMTNMIVHDLRNPISAISASLDILEISSPSEEAKVDRSGRFIGIAKNASRKMMGLVDDILAVSKFEAGALSLNLRGTLVSLVISTSLDGFRSQSEAENKQMGAFCPEGLMLHMDAALITRVLDNLIANALKYIDENTGLVEVVVRPENGKVFFHVRDNGEGIPDTFKSQIFDKFQQAPQNGSERKGTGLGLTFCRMAVETHGGEIFVKNAEGGGSEFIFWLPEKAK